MAAKKEISGFIKLQIKGGQANPAPPVGPALGQRGVNIMEFCKAFNDKTKSLAGKPVPVEITYGLERLCMFVQGKKNVFELNWNNEGVKYKDVFFQAEKEFSAYNFEFANTESLLKNFEVTEAECISLIYEKLSLPAYDQCLEASHIFNLLDSRGVIGVAERTGFINRIRELA